MREGGLHFRVMLCGRGLRTTHIHRPFTAFPAAKIQLIFIYAAYFRNIFFVDDYFEVPGREFDLKSKGYNSGDVSQKDLYREMIFKLMK